MNSPAASRPVSERACDLASLYLTIKFMRMLFWIVAVVVLLNLGARCPVPQDPVPEGCERLGGAGLLHCPTGP
jgi:hypothetical protein